MTLADIKKIFDRNFVPPFVPKGTVRTWWSEQDGNQFLHIAIAGRDVQLNEQGKVVGAGTSCGCGWDDEEEPES